MIAALFVAEGGAYYGLPDVDPWPESRDARLYAGPWPVVAHPPCSRWCQLARVNEARYGHKVGDDGGCFAAALCDVRDYGGVLEHPAESIAWRMFGLQPPAVKGWVRSLARPDEWTTEVCQRNYGHRAQKRTWLLYVGHNPPPPLDWSKPKPPEAWISTDRPRAELGHVAQLSKKEAKATPPAFRDMLLALARNAWRVAA